MPNMSSCVMKIFPRYHKTRSVNYVVMWH